MPAAPGKRDRRLGRYTLYDKIGAGGMAIVHLGRFEGEGGFSRVVAIKCMASHLAESAELRAMFTDEARLASRVRHPNVVSTIDVGTSDSGLFLVMEYVPGESLAALLRRCFERKTRIPIPIAVRIAIDTLSGLHAAHTATDELGGPLAIVHRDVSPQNVIVSPDGLARVLDFGVAKAIGQSHVTQDGHVKGKFRYMAPEQIGDRPVGPATDVYAASVVLWESLTGERLFTGTNDAAIVARVLEGIIPPPSKLAPEVPNELDWIVLRGLSRDPKDRFGSALEMAETLERLGHPATAMQVGRWVEEIAGETIRRRKEQIARMHTEASSPSLRAPGAESWSAEGPVGSEDGGTRTSTLDGTLPDPFVPVAAGQPGEEASARKRSRGRTVALVGAAAIALVTIGFFVATSQSSPPPPFIAPAAPAAPPSGQPVQWLHAANAVAAAASVNGEIKDDADSALLGASSSAPIDSGASSRPVFFRPSHFRPRPMPVAKPGCTPPTYMDPTGIRRVKPECL